MKKLIYLIALMLTCKVCSSQIVPPYFNDFESDTSGWYVLTTSGNAWQWDTISTGSGTTGMAFGVGLDGAVIVNSKTALYSPIFDFTNTSNSTLSFWQNFDCKANDNGARLEYSVNGAPWILLDNNIGQVVNWFNSVFLLSSGLPGWTGFPGGFLYSSISLDSLSGLSAVQFRFVFSSVSTPWFDYHIIDNFCICNNSVGINQAPLSTNSINIYPNPFSDKLNINIKGNDLVEISLYDVTARKIINQSFTTSTSINTEQLAKGIYIYEVRNKSGPDSYREIKKGKVVKD